MVSTGFDVSKSTCRHVIDYVQVVDRSSFIQQRTVDSDLFLPMTSLPRCLGNSKVLSVLTLKNNSTISEDNLLNNDDNGL